MWSEPSGSFGPWADASDDWGPNPKVWEEGPWASAPEGLAEKVDPEEETDALDMRSLEVEVGACDDEGQWSDGRWQKFCWDSGAAQTVLPRNFAPDVEATGRKYKTASSELIDDFGQMTLLGSDERDQLRRLKGRVSEVHKPLVAASKTTALGYDAFMDHTGGILIPRDGPVGRGMRIEMSRLMRIHGRKGTLPLWLEKGVYNFYLNMEKSKSCGAKMDPPETLAPLTPGGFPRRAR